MVDNFYEVQNWNRIKGHPYIHVECWGCDDSSKVKFFIVHKDVMSFISKFDKVQITPLKVEIVKNAFHDYVPIGERRTFRQFFYHTAFDIYVAYIPSEANTPVDFDFSEELAAL